MAVKIVPYKPASESAKSLANKMGLKRLKAQGGRYKGREGDVVINWGSTKPELFQGLVEAVRVINPPEAVKLAINKLDAFNKLKEHGVPIPEYTTNKADAEGWAVRRGVVCRTKLTGSGGEGIVLAHSVAELVEAPLYVKYIPKEHEYRVHVMGHQAFFSQRKARDRDVPNEQVNWQVRNLAGGFIYSHIDVVAPPGVLEAAVGAVRALGLDFGAVDLITTQRGNVYVLEVNTACGLQGTTLDKYAEAFAEFLTNE